MTLATLALVFLSACLHVTWNTLVKTSADKASFAWTTSLVSGAVLVPVFALSRALAPGPLPPEAFGWAALSGLFEAGYVVLLFGAYGRADLSLVYPLSRGMAPLVTVSLGGALLGDRISGWSGAAVGLVVAGVAVVSFSRPRRGAGPPRGLTGVLLAAGAGCLIASYQMVDRRAMRAAAPPSPVEYLCLMHAFLAAYVSAWAGLAGIGKARLLSEWAANRRGVLLVGTFTPLAYLLIVLALREANVTYVAAARNVGVLLSLAVGALLLRERVGPARLLGGTLILCGLVGLVVVRSAG
jgi:drug/metabolite transporter (DMT)-like permease